MKRSLIILLALIFVSALSACTNQTGGGTDTHNTSATAGTTVTAPKTTIATTAAIARDRAIDIALQAAQLKQTEIRDLDAEFDYERGIAVWEVDFEAGGYDYSYTIDAAGGQILHSEREKDDR